MSKHEIKKTEIQFLVKANKHFNLLMVQQHFFVLVLAKLLKYYKKKSV